MSRPKKLAQLLLLARLVGGAHQRQLHEPEAVVGAVDLDDCRPAVLPVGDDLDLVPAHLVEGGGGEAAQGLSWPTTKLSSSTGRARLVAAGHGDRVEARPPGSGQASGSPTPWITKAACGL